ncbi:putative membrane protein YeaQ/YmgE (transglycosylase-associated protein family) [Rhodopirellula rubra]|uniref:Putative membrane protein YeaQ/YmgE (Transglycosylase-associated protein family) n=1 Tax=Aporhodopirellula rubra TaxID=980271 RepID=A0A7W5H8A4_9BACT|nr:GlsB/YeaQ/YmgE family stress response membrane protein [Aporhodopirellula rubra]MBB3210487.1 putative membrane protein YeaQ/YmgE (transglycosylase-associated protein family) [Aporhodopirellula rubra]
MFWLAGWIAFGLVVGLVARAVIPGEQPMGCLATTILGIAGSFIGGSIGYFLVGGTLVQSSGWIGSIIGAVILLAIRLRRDRSTT